MSPATSFVIHAYDDLVNRPADTSGLAYWVGQVNAGVPHTTVAANLANTSDYRNLIVTNAYMDVLRREPDAGGLTYWMSYLAKGGGVEQLTGALVGSSEYTSMFGTQYDAFVKAAYMTILQRTPDAGGEAYWVGRLGAGAPMWNVAASISHTPEWYSNRVTFDYAHYHIGSPDQGGLLYWAGRMQHGMPESQLAASLVGSGAYATWAAAH